MCLPTFCYKHPIKELFMLQLKWCHSSLPSEFCNYSCVYGSLDSNFRGYIGTHSDFGPDRYSGMGSASEGMRYIVIMVMLLFIGWAHTKSDP